MYKSVFLAHRHFFSSGRGSFLVLSALWHAGSPPGPRVQVWALAEVRGTCSGSSKWHAGSPPGPRVQVWALAEVRGTCSGGSKWQVPMGRDSKHVEPSRPLQTHVQIKRMSKGSCDIWNLECHQCRQTLLTWW